MYGIRSCSFDDLLAWRRLADGLKAIATIAAINREIDRRAGRRAAA